MNTITSSADNQLSTTVRTLSHHRAGAQSASMFIAGLEGGSHEAPDRPNYFAYHWCGVLGADPRPAGQRIFGPTHRANYFPPGVSTRTLGHRVLLTRHQTTALHAQRRQVVHAGFNHQAAHRGDSTEPPRS